MRFRTEAQSTGRALGQTESSHSFQSGYSQPAPMEGFLGVFTVLAKQSRQAHLQIRQSSPSLPPPQGTAAFPETRLNGYEALQGPRPRAATSPFQTPLVAERSPGTRAGGRTWRKEKLLVLLTSVRYFTLRFLLSPGNGKTPPADRRQGV